MKRFLDFFAINNNITGMLFMVVFIGLGEKLGERFLPIYLLLLGGSSLLPGILNGLDNLLSALYSFPGGYITERIGYKKSLLLFNIIAIIGFLIVICIPHWIAVFIGSFLFISWTSLSLPATMDLISTVLPKNKHTMGVSIHSLVRRIPMALGPIMGGILIDTYGINKGIHISFSIAVLLGVISLVFQQLLINDIKPVKNIETLALLDHIKTMSKPLKILLTSDILIRFCEQIPYAYLAIWAMESPNGAHVSGKQFGYLTAIEMVVALLIYIPVAWIADKGSKKKLVAITFFNFAIFPIVLFYSRSFTTLIIAFIVRGLKEFGEPTRKTLIMDLAPADKKATTFGTYYLIRDVIVSLAAFASGFLWQYSPALNFFLASIFGFIGFFIFTYYGKDARKVITPAT